MSVKRRISLIIHMVNIVLIVIIVTIIILKYFNVGVFGQFGNWTKWVGYGMFFIFGALLIIEDFAQKKWREKERNNQGLHEEDSGN